jgi:putative endonuclease
MYIVYVIQSQTFPHRYYIGFTTDLDKRLIEHNKGRCLSTKPYMPWVVRVYITFHSEDKALQFEKYLKSGSGHAFFRKRLI